MHQLTRTTEMTATQTPATIEAGFAVKTIRIDANTYELNGHRFTVRGTDVDAPTKLLQTVASALTSVSPQVVRMTGAVRSLRRIAASVDANTPA